MKFQKLNFSYLLLIISYFFLLKLNIFLYSGEVLSLTISKTSLKEIPSISFFSLSINYFFLDFFKNFKLFNFIEIAIILIPILFIRNKEFNFGILFSYILYLFLFVPFLVLFFDPNSNIIEIFFQYIDLNSDYISIEKNKFYLFIFILTINFCILLFFTSNNKKIYYQKVFYFRQGKNFIKSYI